MNFGLPLAIFKECGVIDDAERADRFYRCNHVELDRFMPVS
jgi:hypothetical protein